MILLTMHTAVFFWSAGTMSLVASQVDYDGLHAVLHAYSELPTGDG